MRRRAKLRPGRAALLLLSLVVLTVAGANRITYAATVGLERDNTTIPITSSLRFISDDKGEIDAAEAVDRFNGDLAETVGKPIFDLGSLRNRIWLSAVLTNLSDERATWHLATGIPYIPVFRASVLRVDGTSEPVIDYTLRQAFGERPLPGRFLVSGPIHLRPAETARLLIEFWPAGPSRAAFTLQRPDIVYADMLSDGIWTAIFYAVSVAVLVLFLVFNIALRNRPGLLFTGLFAGLLLLTAQFEGVAFQVLWPDLPEWNALAAFPLLCCISAYGLGIAWYLLRPSAGSRLKRGLAIATIASALLSLSPVSTYAITVPIAYLFFVAMLAANSLVVWRVFDGQAGHRGALTTLGLLVVGTACFLIMRSYFPALDVFSSDDNDALAGDSLLLRGLYAFASTITMGLIAADVMALKNAHTEALEREVDAARRDAELNRALFDAERNYAQAARLAAEQRQRMETASHDIRQPLASLRLSLDAAMSRSGEDRATRDRLSETFDYLDRLTAGYASGSSEDSEDGFTSAAETKAPDGSEPMAEAYSIALITDAVAAMFTNEAQAKGLDFQVSVADCQTRVPVMAMMRVVSNLVSNAVKHTETGGISIDAHPAADRVVISICDTGPGMSTAEFDILRQRRSKGEGSDGHGLGLAIVDDLCRDNGVDLELKDAADGGTCFVLSLPGIEV
ncbi:MAG: ATP-binding protein [Pseudomonadota bacterium]